MSCVLPILGVYVLLSTGVHVAQCSEQFSVPYYVPVVKRVFDTIEININLDTEVNAQLVPPRLTPQTETGYIVVQAGDILKLNCESKNPISWTYPEYPNRESKASLNVARRTETKSNFPYKSTLEVSNAFFMDTGFYNCNTLGKTGAISDSTRIYVFVKDSQNLLLSGETVILAFEHKSNVIPCRPTSPDVEVTLSNDEHELGKWNGSSFHSDFAQRWNFTPQEGFTMKFCTFEDEGMYNCIAKSQNDENESTYILHVLSYTESVPTPTVELITEGMKHVEEKLRFSLNCSVNVSSDVKFVLTWEKPNNIAADEGRVIDEDMVTYKFIEEGREVVVGHRILTVKGASKKDTGVYECRIFDHNKMTNSEKYYVEVYGQTLSAGIIVLIAIFLLILVGLIVVLTIKTRKERLVKAALKETGQ